jgi:hypothetical protein
MIRDISVLRDGTSVKAAVMFVQVEGLKACDDPDLVVYMLQWLHDHARDHVDGFALSSVAGIIVACPLNSRTPPNVGFEALLAGWPFSHPLKIGISCGDLAVLVDVDETPNLIGRPINTAARLAFSKLNTGCLVHEDYTNMHDGVIPRSSWLHKRNRVKIDVPGKDHDSPFPSFAAPPTSTRATMSIPPPERATHEPSVLVAYDLSEFSRGDLAQLRRRFEGMTSLVKRLKAQQAVGASSWYASPGGDGGVLAFVGDGLDSAHAVNACRLLQQWGSRESNATGEGRDLTLRLGVHFGFVQTYASAHGIRRPTGRDLFIADQIAGDDHARKVRETIMTHPVALPFVDGNERSLATDYIQLPELTGLGGSQPVLRYARREATTNP